MWEFTQHKKTKNHSNLSLKCEIWYQRDKINTSIYIFWICLKVWDLSLHNETKHLTITYIHQKVWDNAQTQQDEH